MMVFKKLYPIVKTCLEDRLFDFTLVLWLF